MIANVERNGQMFFWRDIPNIPKQEGVTCTPTSVENIPSDDGAPVTLDIFQHEDLYIKAHDLTGETFLHALRINANSGGGPYIFVHDEFVIDLIRPFGKTRGQVPADFPPMKIDRSDRLHAYLSTRVQTGKSNDSFRLKVTNIESMNNDDHFQGPCFMDIEVGKDGNVTFALRNIQEKGEAKLSLLFKTAENGGKFPLVAEVFTRVAKRIEAAAAYQIRN
jgi:hypothetical protein